MVVLSGLAIISYSWAVFFIVYQSFLFNCHLKLHQNLFGPATRTRPPTDEWKMNRDKKVQKVQKTNLFYDSTNTKTYKTFYFHYSECFLNEWWAFAWIIKYYSQLFHSNSFQKCGQNSPAMGYHYPKKFLIAFWLWKWVIQSMRSKCDM